jgi:hypothetical protein
VAYFGRWSQKLIEGFRNSDYANQQDCHLIAGSAYHFGQGAVTWSSKKQQIIALSTVEAEYIAQAHTAKEALWLCNFVSEIRNKPTQAITINSNHQGAIALLKDNKFHTQMKHINIRYHFMKL